MQCAGGEALCAITTSSSCWADGIASQAHHCCLIMPVASSVARRHRNGVVQTRVWLLVVYPELGARLFLLRLSARDVEACQGGSLSAVEDRHPTPVVSVTMSDAEEEQPVAEVVAEEPAEDVEADEAPAAAAAPAEPMDVNTAVQVRSPLRICRRLLYSRHAPPFAACCSYNAHASN